MSFLITEAFTVGLKEALKLWVVWFTLGSLSKRHGMDGLMKALYAGLFIDVILGGMSVMSPASPVIKDYIIRMEGYAFFVFFFFAITVFYIQLSSARAEITGKLPASVVNVLCFFGSVLFFAPDMMGIVIVLRDTAVMKANFLGTFISFCAGVAAILSLNLIGKLRKNARERLPEYVGPAQFLLLLALLKLSAGGIGGLAELSLIPSVQRGTMKFFHDAVHQTFVYLMVPDHPMLKTTVWNFIGILFGPNIAMAFTLSILVAPPAIMLFLTIFAPISISADAQTGAEKRMQKAALMTGRRRLSVMAVIFIAVVLTIWFSGRGEEVSKLYYPKPLPVIEDKGMIIIPITDPTMNLFDGRIHKFSFVSGETQIRLLVVKKPDETLSVCLDACEICPPDGYGQAEGNVVCIYCKTPIPIQTLGKSGGCNPIPLKASISDKDIRISAQELTNRWKDVKSKQSEEGVR